MNTAEDTEINTFFTKYLILSGGNVPSFLFIDEENIRPRF